MALYDISPGQPSGTELDYVELTSANTGLSISSTSDGNGNGTAVIDGNTLTLDGNTRIKIEFSSPLGGPTASGDLLVNIYDGTTDLGRICDVSANAQLLIPLKGERFLTPSSGAHTYHIRAWRSAASAKIWGGAGGASTYMPAWYRVIVA